MEQTLAGDTGVNKQPGLLSVRSALVRCGAQVREGRKERNEGRTWSQGIELRGRSYAGVFSHSEQTGVICAPG